MLLARRLKSSAGVAHAGPLLRTTLHFFTPSSSLTSPYSSAPHPEFEVIPPPSPSSPKPRKPSKNNRNKNSQKADQRQQHTNTNTNKSSYSKPNTYSNNNTNKNNLSNKTNYNETKYSDVMNEHPTWQVEQVDPSSSTPPRIQSSSSKSSTPSPPKSPPPSKSLSKSTHTAKSSSRSKQSHPTPVSRPSHSKAQSPPVQPQATTKAPTTHLNLPFRQQPKPPATPFLAAPLKASSAQRSQRPHPPHANSSLLAASQQTRYSQHQARTNPPVVTEKNVHISTTAHSRSPLSTSTSTSTSTIIHLNPESIHRVQKTRESNAETANSEVMEHSIITEDLEIAENVAVDLESSEAEAELGGVQDVDAQAELASAEDVEAEGAEAEGTEIEGAESEGAESEGAEAEGAEAEGAEAEGAEAESAEAEGAEAESAETESAEEEGVETGSAEAKDAEAEVAEVEGAQVEGTEAENAETEGAEAEGIEANGASEEGAEAENAETESAEAEGVEAKVVEAAEADNIEMEGAQAENVAGEAEVDVEVASEDVVVPQVAQKAKAKAKKQRKPAKTQESKKKSAKPKRARQNEDEDEDDDDYDDSANKPSRSKAVKYEEDLDPSMLNDEQVALINLIEEGKNIFFTGSAGTGKSFVLKHIVARLRKKHPRGVYLTAATGIAAVNIGGETLHSFAGIHFGLGDIQGHIERVMKSKKALKRWKQCRVLIIDEISMINCDYFDKLDAIAKKVHGNNTPFGSIQLVLCGDFFQLPPVKGKFIFDGQAWRACNLTWVELTTVMRQTDPKFVKILNELRRGLMTDTSMLELRKCCRPIDAADGIIPTKLYTTNVDVDRENETALNQLVAERVCFEAYDEGDKEKLKHLPVKDVVLKIGAQVVLLRKVKNLDGLVNGSRGVVIGYEKLTLRGDKYKEWRGKNSIVPIVRFANGVEAAIPPVEWKYIPSAGAEKGALRRQIPLKLAWALTIHRAQGMTLDKVQVVLNNTFAPGQAYVALSRVRSLEGLYIKALSRGAILTNATVFDYYKRMIKQSTVFRAANTGNIKSFSVERGTIVTPPGQIIHYPSGSKTIGPHNSTPVHSTTTTVHSTIIHTASFPYPPPQSITAYTTALPYPPTQSSASSIAPLQAISGGFLNAKTAAATVAIRTVTDSHTSEADAETDVEMTVAVDSDSETAEVDSETKEADSETEEPDSEAEEADSEATEQDDMIITEVTETYRAVTQTTNPQLQYQHQYQSNGHTHEPNGYNHQQQPNGYSQHYSYNSHDSHDSHDSHASHNSHQPNGHTSHKPNGHKSNGHTRQTTSSTTTSSSPIEYYKTNKSSNNSWRSNRQTNDEDDEEGGERKYEYEGSIFDQLNKVKV